MYFLKDICCLCLNSQRRHMKRFDASAYSEMSYLRKLTTIIPELSFKKMKKRSQLFVCGQCCQQIDQMHRFRARSLRNQNMFVEYVDQLSFLDGVRCQLSVRLTDLQHLGCIRDEPTDTIGCKNEIVANSLYNANLPIKQEFQEIVVVKTELESCCEISKLDCLKPKHCHQLDETSNLGNNISQLNPASYIKDDAANAPTLEFVVVESKLESCCDMSQLECRKSEHCHQLDETSNLKHSHKHIGQDSSASYIKDGAVNVLQSSNVLVCTSTPEQQQRADDFDNATHASGSCTSLKHRNEGVDDSCIQRHLALPIRHHKYGKQLSQREHLACFSKLKEHERIHSGERPYECKQCDKKFTTHNSLKNHERIHSGEKPYECNACGKTFSWFDSLIKHQRIHSGARPYECKQCGKKFARQNSLKRHERIHSGERAYECKQCDKKCNTIDQLKSHERIHSKERPYDCKTCGKKFKDASTLRHHERIHTGEQPYACQECGKTFSRLDSLNKHERIHSEERPYECKQCGKTFKRLSHLKSHERIHSGERPYECKVCSKKFNTLSYLKVHEHLHSGERPYECKACSKKFNTLSYLKIHERLHSGERPYDCQECGKKFKTLSTLRIHNRTHNTSTTVTAT